MDGGSVGSGNLCQVGWKNTADDIEKQRLYDARALLPAAVSKGAAAFSLLAKSIRIDIFAMSYWVIAS